MRAYIGVWHLVSMNTFADNRNPFAEVRMNLFYCKLELQ